MFGLRNARPERGVILITMEDLKIIELYNERSESAIEKTAEKYGAYLFSTAFNVVRSHEDAEECVSDGYLKTWNAIPPARPNSLKLFIAKIVRNSAIDRWLANTAEKRGGSQIPICLDELSEIAAPNSGSDSEFDSKAAAEVISRYLSKKDFESANIFVRRYWYMDSIAEIAEKYNASEGRVKTLLFRMRAELKEELSKEGIKI